MKRRKVRRDRLLSRGVQARVAPRVAAACVASQTLKDSASLVRASHLLAARVGDGLHLAVEADG
jgi:hypothetical protein